MNYILHGDCLIIDKVQNPKQTQKTVKKKKNRNKQPEGYQYYQWHYKQKLQKEEAEFRSLRKLLTQIQTNEKQINKENNPQSRHKGTFYDYNLEWKARIDKKREEEKQMMNQMEEQHLYNMEMKRNNPISTQSSLFVDHKGPIQGWYEHFDHYIKNKAMGGEAKDQNTTFCPKINKRSQRITEGLTEKVENRLIQYGQFIKKKHQELELSSSHHNSSTLQSVQSDFQRDKLFERLYREGEELNRRKIMQEQSKESFQPKTNRISKQLESRILLHRKPLYYVKNSLSQESSEPLPEKKVGDFKGFMKRNQALLNLRKNMEKVYEQQQLQRSNIQKSKCTFSPALNKKSKMILQQRQEQVRQHCEIIHSKIAINCTNSQGYDHAESLMVQDLNVQQISKISGQSSDSLSAYEIASKSSQSVDHQIKKKHHPNFIKNNYATSNDVALVQQQDQDQMQEDYEPNTDRKFSSRVFTTSAQAQLHSQRQNLPITNSIKQNEQYEQNKDSIEQLQSSEKKWQSQLEEIENHIEEMMSRALCST